MMNVTVVFLDKNRIQFYEGKDKNLVSLEVPQTIMKDLEIIDPGALRQLIHTFLGQHKITSSQAIIILSDNVTMSRDLTGTKEEKDRQAEAFFAALPFEMVQSKRYVLGEREQIVALGRGGYEPLVTTLTSEGFPVIAIIPTFVLGPMKEKRWLDVEMGNYVIREVSKLSSESITPTAGSSESTEPQTIKVNRVTIGVAILVILVIVLLFLFVGRT